MKQESIIVIEIMPTVTIPKVPLLVFASKVILETVLIAQVTISKRLDILKIKRIPVDIKWNSVRSKKRLEPRYTTKPIGFLEYIKYKPRLFQKCLCLCS